MSNVNRRDAAKLAAGLALGAGGLTAARADEPGTPAGLPADPALALIAMIPPQYMLSQHVTTTLTGGGGYPLVVTSATNAEGKVQPVCVKSGKVTVFRAGPGSDDFTKTGGWTWKCGKTEGQSAFNARSPFNGDKGPLVMVVRQTDDTVHWYSLILDLRC